MRKHDLSATQRVRLFEALTYNFPDWRVTRSVLGLQENMLRLIPQAVQAIRLHTPPALERNPKATRIAEKKGNKLQTLPNSSQRRSLCHFDAKKTNNSITKVNYNFPPKTKKTRILFHVSLWSSSPCEVGAVGPIRRVVARSSRRLLPWKSAGSVSTRFSWPGERRSFLLERYSKCCFTLNLYFCWKHVFLLFYRKRLKKESKLQTLSKQWQIRFAWSIEAVVGDIARAVDISETQRRFLDLPSPLQPTFQLIAKEFKPKATKARHRNFKSGNFSGKNLVSFSFPLKSPQAL